MSTPTSNNPAAASPQWTPDQSAAIYTREKGIVVSAAAGSGKTSVLAERCAHLVCDGPDRCDITEVLVLTFTNLAADEMRHRIRDSIEKRAELAPGDGHIRKQVAMLDRARISTIDSFYMSLIRRHFQVLGVDPSVDTFADEQASLLMQDVAREVIETTCEEKTDVGVGARDLARFYFEHDEAALAERLVRLYRKLAALPDRKEWFERARSDLYDACDVTTMLRCASVIDHLNFVRGQIDQVVSKHSRAAELVETLDASHPYIAFFKSISTIVTELQSIARLDDPSLLETTCPSFAKGRKPTEKTGQKSTASAKAWIHIDSLREMILKFLKLTTHQDQLLRQARSTLPMGLALLDLLQRFETTYAKEKAARSVVDYDDAAALTLRLLFDQKSQTPTDLARQINDELRHVLVDEAQDLSPVQDKILSLVSSDWRGRKGEDVTPNLFMVGDVKQSIYRFRLAAPELLLDRARYADTHTTSHAAIFLRENYRTRPNLLRSINGVFTHLMLEDLSRITYDQTQQLRPGSDYPIDPTHRSFEDSPIPFYLIDAANNDGHEDELEHGDTRDDTDGNSHDSPDTSLDASTKPSDIELQAREIARQIKELIDQGRTVFDKRHGAYRPMKLSDVAVLLRVAKVKAQQVAQVLRDHGIAARASDKSGFFDSTEVRDVLSLLDILDNRFRDLSLVAVLRSPIAGLDDVDSLLARIRMSASSKDVSFAQAALNYAARLELPGATELASVFVMLERWRDLARLGNTPELIDHIYETSGLIEFNRALRRGDQRVANLIELRDHARRFSGDTSAGLSRFVAYLRDLEEEDTARTPQAAGNADDAVNIMTIHASKGLEFPVVFVPDLSADAARRMSTSYVEVHPELYVGLQSIDRQKLVRYPSVSSLAIQRNARRQGVAEIINLLYVAFTRAREHLVLLGQMPKKPYLFEENDGAPQIDAEFLLDKIVPSRWLHAVAAREESSIQIVPVAAISDSQPSLSAAGADLTLLRSMIARSQPIGGADVLTSSIAPATLASLTTIYPHATASMTRSTAAASSLAHAHAPDADAAEVPRTSRNLPDDIVLVSPLFIQDTAPTMTPGDIGTAVHRFFELLDLSRPLDRADLDAQAAEMVSKRLMTQNEIEAIDTDDIAWMFTSELGRLMIHQRATLHRELPLEFVHSSPDSPDSPKVLQDAVLVRGRIDALIELPEGLVLIDYKTDRIGKHAAAERARHHALQLAVYADAIARAVGKPVLRSVLVFLTPRICIDV